jgi:hypothetical protein
MLHRNPNRWDIAVIQATLTIITDNPSYKAKQAGFLESDRIRTLDLPQNECLVTITKSIESAMRSGRSKDVRPACAEFLDAASTKEFRKRPDAVITALNLLLSE